MNYIYEKYKVELQAEKNQSSSKCSEDRMDYTNNKSHKFKFFKEYNKNKNK
jgi:hypothetical protein